MEIREHLNNNYQNHSKTFTDSSTLDSLDSAAGFIIPHLKVQKYFYLVKFLMALYYICNIQLAIFNVLICVDSKSVLYAL